MLVCHERGNLKLMGFRLAEKPPGFPICGLICHPGDIVSACHGTFVKSPRFPTKVSDILVESEIGVIMHRYISVKAIRPDQHVTTDEAFEFYPIAILRRVINFFGSQCSYALNPVSPRMEHAVHSKVYKYLTDSELSLRSCVSLAGMRFALAMNATGNHGIEFFNDQEEMRSLDDSYIPQELRRMKLGEEGYRLADPSTNDNI
jgi:hypothetical protein